MARLILDKHSLDVTIKLAYHCGLRRAEIAALDLSHIDLDRQELKVVLGKGFKDRKLGLNQTVVDSIQSYLKIRPQTACTKLLIQANGKPINRKALSQRFNRLAKQAGLDLTLHGLRRGFVCKNADAGVPLVQIQIACGHASISTTEGYYIPDVEATVRSMKSW